MVSMSRMCGAYGRAPLGALHPGLTSALGHLHLRTLHRRTALFPTAFFVAAFLVSAPLLLAPFLLAPLLFATLCFATCLPLFFVQVVPVIRHVSPNLRNRATTTKSLSKTEQRDFNRKKHGRRSESILLELELRLVLLTPLDHLADDVRAGGLVTKSG